MNAEHATLFAKLIQLDFYGIADILSAVVLAPTISGLRFVQWFARLSSCCFTSSDYCALPQLSTLAFVLVPASNFTTAWVSQASRMHGGSRMKIVWLTASLVFVIAFALIAMARPLNLDATATHEGTAGAAELFSRNCAKCHGKDGRAKGFKGKLSGARNLTDPEWQERVSDERIFNSIKNGKGRMPAFGKKLSAAEVESLVQYVRGLKK
jgi:mono/diheme cytochrome c family protein